MKYSEFVVLYERIAGTTKKLEKTEILGEFFKSFTKEKKEWIYLLKGRVWPDYDSKEFGISTQLVLKAISSSYGIDDKKVMEKFKQIGDLGEVAYFYNEKKKQNVLFSKKLDVQKVFENLRRISEIEGKGSVERKISLISELLNSASSLESKYIIRTLLSDLRIGIADALIIDSLVFAFAKERKEEVEEVFDMTNDFALVFECAFKNKFDDFKIDSGKPMRVMLAVKAENIEDAFEICGKPAAFEFKYDGFRVLITKKDEKIKLFTRKLEDVTLQFPDVVSAVLNNVKGKNFILDAEIVGYDGKTGKYKPFEYISQRIKRKYEVSELIKKLPVEINIFDILFLDNNVLMKLPFFERRKVIEKIVKSEERVIRLSRQIITDSIQKAEDFYQEALKIGEEGVMIKNINSPYKPGRKVGYMAKLKPVLNDLDLVIVGAEYGTGKRGGWLTSYVVACKSNGEFLEVGRVSSGLKEKEEEGTSYDEMTKLLKPLITGEDGNQVHIKPEVVVSVNYQNIQRSPSYSSGFALRFPRITHYRPDKKKEEIATLKEIEEEAGKGR